MKVLHVTESMATGTLAMISSAVYSTNQYNIEIAYAPRGETPEDLHGYFPECRLHKLPRSALAFIVKLKRIVRDSEPDIVHFHSSIGAAYGRLALFRNRKIKLFYSPHCISFMRKDVGAIKLFLFRSCERVLDVISPSTYIACSESERRVLKQAGIGCELLENCISDSFINKVDERRICRARSPIILTVGGIREQKGPALFSRIANHFASSKVRFYWIGDGEEGFKKQLIGAGVCVLGWKTQDEIVDLLGRAAIYLSTSDWEGLPVSVIEAQASEIPCLLKSCAGNVDLVDHRKNGYIFDDYSAAIDLIERYLAGGWAELEVPTKEQVLVRFSERNYGLNLIKIYSAE